MFKKNNPKNIKVLVVDDEEALLDIAMQELKFKKYNVEGARDGEEALEKAKIFKPDIMILDIELPKKSGLEVLQEIKADPEIKNIRVVIVSNFSDKETVQKGLSLGAENYFVKTDYSMFKIIEKVVNQAKA